MIPSNNPEEKYPEKLTRGDFENAIAKAGYSAVPLFGGAMAEFYSLTVQSPLEDRRIKWLNNLYDSMIKLSNEIESFKPKELSKNENFVSAILQATDVAIKVHNQEKIKSLKNAVLNSVVSKINSDEQSLFIQRIDSMTPAHLDTLMQFDKDGPLSGGLRSDTSEVTGSTFSLVGFPQYEANVILNDLDNWGFFQKTYSAYEYKKNLNVLMRLSKQGKRFLEFISRDE